MAKLSDVQFSLQGENPGVPQHQQKHSEVLSPVYEKQENTGVRYSIFKLVSNCVKYVFNSVYDSNAISKLLYSS